MEWPFLSDLATLDSLEVAPPARRTRPGTKSHRRRDAAYLEQLLRRRGRVNSMNCAAPAFNDLALCFLCGGSPGSDALAVVDVHEPSEQRSSVRPVGPPLRVVARESLMVTHRVRVHRPSSARSCAFSATSPFMASRAFAFRSFSRAMCSSGVSSRPNPGLARGTSRGSSNVGTDLPTE
jgi:hypothetical protein